MHPSPWRPPAQKKRRLQVIRIPIHALQFSTDVPDEANLEIYQGDDYAAMVTVLDSSGAPADLAGCQAQAHIRKGPASSYPKVFVDIAAVIEANVITLFIPAAQTIGLTGRYVWDLQLITPDGFMVTILRGYADVTAEITMPSIMA